MKRNKKVAMDINSLGGMVLAHYKMPPDARLKGIEHNPKNKKITFEFEHQTFDLVKTVPLVEDKGAGMSGKLGVKKKKK